MVHRLAQPGRPESAIGVTPMTASLRYRCACGNQELLMIEAVFDASADEERFVWTMRQLWRDMQTEVAQHLREQPDDRT